MTDHTSSRTEVLLERMTTAVAVRLGEDFEDLTRDEATWQSVARLCVMTIVRHLQALAQEKDVILTPGKFAGLSQSLGTPEFAMRAGLSLDDARLALAVTSTNLARAFFKRTVLQVDDVAFVVHNASGKLTIRRGNAATRPTQS